MAGPATAMVSKRTALSFFLLLTLLLTPGMLLGGCALVGTAQLPTPLPEAMLPTVIVLTAQAAQAQATQTNTPAPTPSETASPTAVAPLPTATETLPALETPAPTLSPAPPTAAPDPGAAPFIPPGIPNSLIEIRNLGALSRVASPIHVWGYLKTGARSLARIELLGEDHRLLYGETKVFNVPEGGHAVLSMDIDFEIAVPAEAGRLQIWVEDEHGRVTALNSVPLILLQMGEADINPPSDMLETITVQQPMAKALIQGGRLVVTGLARVAPGTTLLARLVTTEGAQVGQRLAEVVLPPEGGYGAFAAEVPYQVSGPTPALLVVSAGEADLQDIVHLASVEVLLGP